MTPARLRLAIAGLLTIAAITLWAMGRLWWCDCGRWFLVTLDAFGPHTSQHLIDPYSITHVLHGFLFWWLFLWIRPVHWNTLAVLTLETLWEIVENTPFVIDVYRTGTAAVGYKGDTILNALADILCCWLGLLLARRLGLSKSVAVFIAVEIALALWIRDGLLLNILMFIWPSEAVKAWQLGG